MKLKNHTDINGLISRIQKGDQKAFREFIDAYQKLVMHIVFRLVRRKEDQEDLCQEIFLKAYQNLHSFRFECKPSTWIAKIAYYSCLNHLQKKKATLYEDISRNGQTLDHFSTNQIGPDVETEHADIKDRIRHEIGTLHVRYRSILTMYHLDGMSYAEIGEVMSLPEGTVKSHLFRARKALKEKMMAQYEREELWK